MGTCFFLILTGIAVYKGYKYVTNNAEKVNSSVSKVKDMFK